MKKLIGLYISLLLLICIGSCTNKKESLIKVDEVYPWCIVDFDSLDRSPEERIAMLKEMGFMKYGYEGSERHLAEMKEELKQDSLTIVYNFHHAHDYLDEFPEIVKKIKPYLSGVNLNGMEKDGAKILAIGEGDFEYEMIKLLLEEGYNGPWGILGHIKTEDVQKVLKRNIDGLNVLNSKYKMEDEQ